jgi:hypothetical protein
VQDSTSTAPAPPRALPVDSVLGALQILSWGSTFYLLAVLAPSIVRDTGWPYDRVMAGLSIGLLVAARCWRPVPRSSRSALP